MKSRDTYLSFPEMLLNHLNSCVTFDCGPIRSVLKVNALNSCTRLQRTACEAMYAVIEGTLPNFQRAPDCLYRRKLVEVVQRKTDALLRKLFRQAVDSHVQEREVRVQWSVWLAGCPTPWLKLGKDILRDGRSEIAPCVAPMRPLKATGVQFLVRHCFLPWFVWYPSSFSAFLRAVTASSSSGNEPKLRSRPPALIVATQRQFDLCHDTPI